VRGGQKGRAGPTFYFQTLTGAFARKKNKDACSGSGEGQYEWGGGGTYETTNYLDEEGRTI